MNANTIIKDDMTLEEKLAAIDAAMANAQDQAKQEAKTKGIPYVPVDPDTLLQCDGCS